MSSSYELFRFVLARSAVPPKRAIMLRVPDPMPELVAQILGTTLDMPRILVVVDAFLGSNPQLRDPRNLRIDGHSVIDLAQEIEGEAVLALDLVDQAIGALFRQGAERLSESAEFRSARRLTLDALVAFKLRQDRHPNLLADYARIYRLLDLIEMAARGDRAVEAYSGRAFLRRVIGLPDELFPLMRTADGAGTAGGDGDGRPGVIAAPGGTIVPSADVEELAAPAGGRRVRIGRTILPATSLAVGGGVAAEPGGAAAIPVLAGRLQPFVATLLVTRQQIRRYEGGEIAHVENVLRSEHKNRETRRLRRTEETFLAETEVSSEEERDTQTTDRLEIQKEVQNTISESQQHNVGVTVSGGYGPFFNISTSYNFNHQASEEQARRLASTFAHETVEKTAYKVSERVREQRISRIIEEFEEKNSHGFDNVAGDGNIRGVYQWLDKIYQTQIFNYGLRLMFEISVPEPATYLLKIIQQQLAPAEGLAAPDALTIGPADLDENNYLTWVRKYDVAGVEPPPERARAISYVRQDVQPILRLNQLPGAGAGDGGEEEGDGAQPATAGEAAGEEQNLVFFDNWAQTETGFAPDYPGALAFSSAETIDLPKGYAAKKATVQASSSVQMYEDTKAKGSFYNWSVERTVTVQVGRNEATLKWDNPPAAFPPPTKSATIDLDDETTNLSVVVKTWQAAWYTVDIQIECERLPEQFEKWQLETYGAIVQAYKARVAEYEQKLAEAAIQEGVEISGRNPLQNRQIEQKELKRHAIANIIGHRFANTATAVTPSGWYDFEEARVKGAFARFFETALDWANMTYTLHPYYWGRHASWAEKLLIDDVDPLHAEFLRCGSATVRVPVTPEYEDEVLHFLETGMLWQGGENANVTAKSNVALLEEIVARRDGDGRQEIPEGEPFDVRLPTTLVGLRTDDKLPEWVWDPEAGEWLPVEEG